MKGINEDFFPAIRHYIIYNVLSHYFNKQSSPVVSKFAVSYHVVDLSLYAMVSMFHVYKELRF